MKSMEPALFIGREGVLFRKPSADLEFIPGVISGLRKIRRETDLLLILFSNNDSGLMELSREKESPDVRERMFRILEGEGIVFDAVLPSLPSGDCDSERSLVIGDTPADIEAARTLGCRAVWFAPGGKHEYPPGYCSLVSSDWDEISRFITGSAVPLSARIANLVRETSETSIHAAVNLDGTGKAEISTGLRFFDHMLEQLAKHSHCDITAAVRGDLDVDEHHTVEDTALVLGELFRKALGDKLGISRYGFSLPMDDASARALIDFSGRPWVTWDVSFPATRAGDVPTELFFHFFKSFSDTAGCTLHISASGDNTHHIAEAIFKAFARSVRGAVKRDLYNMNLPSTKGVL